jgi:hypothetical protein
MNLLSISPSGAIVEAALIDGAANTRRAANATNTVTASNTTNNLTFVGSDNNTAF